MSKTLLFAALIAAAACSKKKDEPAETKPNPEETKPAETKPAEGEPAQQPTEQGGGDDSPYVPIACDKLLPPALRDKYFKGLEIKTREDPEMKNQASAICDIKFSADVTGSVAAHCHRDMPEDMFKAIPQQRKTSKDHTWTDGVGLGMSTFDSSKSGGKVKMAEAWDDNSLCSVQITAPPSFDATALAKDLLASLPLK